MSLINLIKDYCNKNGDKYSFYENYSGRFMYGETCPGIVVKKGNSYMSMIMDLHSFLRDVGFDDIYCEFEGVSVDELGQDYIVYFPFCRQN